MRIIIEIDDARPGVVLEEGSFGTAGEDGPVDAGPPPAELVEQIEGASPSADRDDGPTDAGPPPGELVEQIEGTSESEDAGVTDAGGPAGEG